MMKLPALLVVIFITVFGFMGLKKMTPILDSKNITPTLTAEPLQSNFTAAFEIYTNGTKRIFTQDMYHNQSPEIYIEKSNPSIIFVKKSGLTWDDFFKTLPFSLTKDCLVTGTKQTFCTTETKKLRFLLNGVENPNTLETQIKPNDNLKITYGD